MNLLAFKKTIIKELKPRTGILYKYSFEYEMSQILCCVFNYG